MGASADVTVHDVTGRTVARLRPAASAAGGHGSASRTQTFHWDGRDAKGVPLARGVYFVRTSGGGAAASAKFVHLGG
jgi:hypothetical protein